MRLMIEHIRSIVIPLFPRLEVPKPSYLIELPEDLEKNTDYYTITNN